MKFMKCIFCMKFHEISSDKKGSPMKCNPWKTPGELPKDKHDEHPKLLSPVSMTRGGSTRKSIFLY
jgi:hypothetical protein